MGGSSAAARTSTPTSCSSSSRRSSTGRRRWARPQSNGFIERFHRTLLDEHLLVKGRTTSYESVDEMQADLDAYLETYNRSWPHCGRGMEGRTLYLVFKKGTGSPGAGRSQPGRR